MSKASEPLKRLQSFWSDFSVRDVFLLAGLVLITVGAGMIYFPAAPLLLGSVFLLLGLFGVPKWP